MKLFPWGFLYSMLLVSAASADWPQWRGPARDGHAPAGEKAPESLPAELPPLWRVKVGGGFSGIVVGAGKLIYTDEANGREVAHCLDPASGRQIWQTDYAASFQDEWGAGPRATPIIHEGRVYLQACNGEFACVSLKDGSLIWRVSFEEDFGVKFLGSKSREGTAQRRGNNGSGVIDGKRLVLPVGSTNGASLVCFDKTNGKVLWKSGTDEAAYSSLVVGTLAGVRQVVAFTADALLGAHLETGRILWRVPLKTNAKRHAATPVISGDTVLVNSHTFGTHCYQILEDGEELRVEPLWQNHQLKINLATPVAVGGHLYSAGAEKDLVCVDARTGDIKWSQPGFGRGNRDYASLIAIGKQILLLTEDGRLTLFRADPSGYQELGQAQLCGSTWSFPALSDGRVYARDGRELICVALQER